MELGRKEISQAMTQARRVETGKRNSGVRTTSLSRVEPCMLSSGQGAGRKRARCSPSHFDDFGPSHARFGSNKAHSRRINMQ
jgi:hypothetical protein